MERAWKFEPAWATTQEHGTVWIGLRNDGQNFFVKYSDESKKELARTKLESFLDSGCRCSVDGQGETCPRHPHLHAA